MYLKNDKIVATIKGLTFRSFRFGSQGQFVLDPTALTGWTDGTTVRRSATVRPVSSGDFTEPYTFASRLIGITGTAIAKDRSELQTMRDRFVGLLQEDEYAEIGIETSVGTRFAIVGLEGTPSWVQQLDNVAVFRIEFYAPDPHIYGQERTISLGSTTAAGGGLVYPLNYPMTYNPQKEYTQNYTVTNRGNAPMWPRFKTTGDYYSGFSVTNGKDNKVTFNGMVTKSSPVLIDMAKGTAFQNGIDKSVLLSEREWFSIAPGETIEPEFSPIQDASGWCDIIVRDTFI